MRRLALAASATIPVMALTGERGGAAPAPWKPAPAAAAAFLQRPSSVPWSSAAAGSARGHLPSSVLPFLVLGGVCSVDTTDLGNPPACSTNAAAVRCSALSDAQQRCSALLSSAGGTAAACSATGGNGARCSVFLPPFNPVAGSACSALGGPPGTSIACSVIAPGARQGCSAENPAQTAGNFCSTLSAGASGGVHQCSVLNGGNQRNFCSMVNSPGLFATTNCSTLTAGSACSVRAGSRGVCTNFNGAPTGVCSAFVAASHCSVIGGGAGFLCRWP
ncbi:MAG: hypothetical protein EYC70_17295 [Planctomycetota bacterium]|nr:MAG: hypothetical protein EYC70_17295 [Planctomycetota bacterium]